MPVSIKSLAWTLAAMTLESSIKFNKDGQPQSEVEAHILNAVVPALRRKAEIIERNTKERR